MDMIQGPADFRAPARSRNGGVEALEGPQDFIAQSRKIFGGAPRPHGVHAQSGRASVRHIGLKGRFTFIPPARRPSAAHPPSGRKIATDVDFVTALLEEQGVAVVQARPSAWGQISASAMRPPTPR